MAYRLLQTGATTGQYLSYAGRVTALDGASVIQVAFWWRPYPNGPYSRQNPVCQNDVTNTSGLYVGTGGTITTLQFSNIGTAVKSYSTLTTDVWQHILITMEGTAAAMYVDGTAVTLTGGGIEADCDANTAPFFIGKRSDADYFTSAEIAEVAIWVGGTVLDATARTALASGRLPTAQTAWLESLVFYAPCREYGHDVVGGLQATAVNAPLLVAHPAVVDVYGEARRLPRPAVVQASRPSVARRTV